MLLLIEFGLCVAAALLGLITPRLGARWFEKLENLFGRLARRQRLAVVAVGLLALALRAAVLPVEPIPEPGIHDEFSYLLMADTFAHGRVANPTHPMWIHFETFHVIQKPTYVSKYFPAQGLFLAAGQVILGHPFWGVWISAGFMCAAICWMLQGWLPPEWALLGGFLAVIRLGTFSYWANSYLGGAVAAIGGALVLGALPRIKQQQRVRDALWMGLGIAILATSRPYEGLFLSVPIGAALLIWMFGKSGPSLRVSMRRVILPLALLTTVTAAAMLFYFWRTTGSPLLTPYALDREVNDPIPTFPWQAVHAFPSYNHAVMREYYQGVVLEQYQPARRDPFISSLIRTIFLWAFFLGPVLTLPLGLSMVVLSHGRPHKRISHELPFLLLACGISFLGLLLPIYFSPHYAAPFTGAIYAVVLLAMRKVSQWQCWGRTTGLFIVRAVPSICLVLLIFRLAAQPLRIPLPPPRWPSWCSPNIRHTDRAAVQAQTSEHNGDNLLIVRYGKEHDPNDEWVYNGADIDDSKVIWARDMGSEKNRELLEYFKDRKVWLVEPDSIPSKVSPYSTSGSEASVSGR